MIPLTTISVGYLDLLAVWRRQAHHVLNERARVVCMDHAAYEQLQEAPDIDLQLASTPLLNAANRRQFWVNRLAVMRAAFDEDGYVLHSDSDAFWLRNPLHLTTLADLVISMEHGLPKDVTRRRGFVVCCGFLAMRKNRATSAFFDAWQAACARSSDDQISINLLLDRAISQWEPTIVEGQASHTATVDFGGGPFKVLVLADALVTRQHAFDVTPATYVAHPFFERRFHKAFVALYSKLVSEKLLGSFKMSPPPSGMKRRDWAAYCCYQQLGEDIPAECLHHAAFLAMKAKHFEDAIRYFENAPEVDGDALVDLYELQRKTGQRKAAYQTMAAAAAKATMLSDRQLNKLLKHLIRAPHPAVFRLARTALGRYSKPGRFREGIRRLYLQARGSI